MRAPRAFWSAAALVSAVGVVMVAPFVVGQTPAEVGVGSESESDMVTVADWNADSGMAGSGVRQNAQQVFEAFAGTVAERNALMVIKTYQANKPMDQCMEDRGYAEWDWSLSRPYADPTDPMSISPWFAQPMARWRSHDVVAARPFLFAERVMNAALPAAEDAAVRECLREVRDQVKPTYVDSPDKSIRQVERAWHQMVYEFERAHAPDRLDYYTCMNDADVTILDGQGLLIGDVGEAMSGASPADDAIPEDPNNPEQWSNPDWQEFLAKEQQFFEQDWNCRMGVYQANIDALGSAVDEFATANASLIEGAKAYWLDVQARALALGYSGQVGSLDGAVSPDRSRGSGVIGA